MKRDRGFNIHLLPSISSESGQSLVELCVGFSLLVLILLGAVEFGQVAFTSIKVANAAKAGVQYGSGVTYISGVAQGGCNAGDSTGIQNAVQAAAPTLSGITSAPTISCACSDGSASTCANTDCPNSHREETLTVQTQYTLTPIIRMQVFPSSFTLKGQARQKCGY